MKLGVDSAYFCLFSRVLHVGYVSLHAVKGKAIPLQTSTGPEGSSRLRLPDFKTVGT